MSVVIPAKNEAANIGWVLDRMPAIVDEVVVVDGLSVDGTLDVARRSCPEVVIVSDDRPGKGAAVRAGVAAATGEFVVIIDADGSMEPLEIESFVRPLFEGHDLVRGSRFLPGAGSADISRLRSLGNLGLLAVANLLFRTSRSDLCYGYAAFRRDSFERLGLDADGFEIEAQLFLRAEWNGLRVTEVPSFEFPRRSGDSNLNTFRDGWRVLLTIGREWLRGLNARRRPASPGAETATPERAPGPALVSLGRAGTRSEARRAAPAIKRSALDDRSARGAGRTSRATRPTRPPGRSAVPTRAAARETHE